VAEAVSTYHARIQVCALLPDTTSSNRYEQFDKPYLAKAFKAAGVSAAIYNAQGSSESQYTQAIECLKNGAQVILLDALDPVSGARITTDVVDSGAVVVDYDRLVVGSRASYYVSFHPLKVGELLGKGLVAALKKNGKYLQMPVIAELNGAITDNNAILFKQGYDSVLDPLYNSDTFKKAIDGDQWTDWDPLKALTIFEQMLTLNNNQIDGVLAANDGLAGSVVSALKKSELDPVALTGQDATATGVQHILAGWQYGTVFKSIKREAEAAAKVAINIIKHKRVLTNSIVSGTPSVLLTPSWITKANYKMLFSEGFLKKADVCKGIYKQYCTRKTILTR
jgi:D-xylose transport system substrate-binding protein